MAGDSDTPTDGQPSSPAVGNSSQPPEESKSSPVPPMSGALQDEDAKDAMKSAEEPLESSTNDSVEASGAAHASVKEPADSENRAEDDAAAKDSHTTTVTSTTAGEANGTPPASKKTPNGKRKSTGGVPEHKTKKLNKRKSISKTTHLDAQPGEYYFARLKSYPPWPAIICDEGMLPHSLLSTRPVTTKQADATYKEPYADGGKKAQERTFPVMFLHTNEFAWLANTELSKLEPEECKDFPEKGKTKSLIQAYHVAAEEHDLEHFKDMLLDHQKAMQEDQERREAREAAKAEKVGRAEKKKRKSDVAEEDEDVDMDDDGEEGEPQPKKASKKRKKEVETDGEDDKPTKTPKTATKLKLTTPKAPGGGEKKGKDSSKASKSKSASARKKSKAAASDEDVVDEAAKEPEKELDPGEAKAKKEKEVLFLRHKLQKGFLARDQAPQESEMSTMSNFITKLENYGDLEVSIIRSTKINKVLKALIKLNSIPKDEEFNFKSRSLELLGRWNKALGAEGTTDENAAPSGGDKGERPTTNGVHEEDKEAGEEKTEAPTPAGDAAPGDESAANAAAETKDAAIDKMVDGEVSSTATAEQEEMAGGKEGADGDSDAAPAA